MSPGVSVIVVNYRAGELTRRCIEFAARDLADVGWSAIVVDNSASDPEADPLRADDLARTTLIGNDRNVGFGAAINQAVRTTGAPLLWLLNPDCEVLAGTFAALSATLDRHPECAIAAPQLLNADGSTQASARGDPGAWTGLFGRNTLLTKFFPSAAVARRNLPAADLVASGVESAPVDWVMGASMLVRREPFDLAGGFDERYFLYWEDADLCRRLRERGWSTRYVPAARVIHSGGASAKTRSREATRAFHRSAYLYYATHVVPSPWHPARWFARAALTARAWWRMR
jgi:N-acetylglucosaminyl-diphospho-decaprenol L-rhamnosyltransferase